MWGQVMSIGIVVHSLQAIVPQLHGAITSHMSPLSYMGYRCYTGREVLATCHSGQRYRSLEDGTSLFLAHLNPSHLVECLGLRAVFSSIAIYCLIGFSG